MTGPLQEQITALAEMVGRLSVLSIALDENVSHGGSDAADAEFRRRWSELEHHLPSIDGRRVLVLGDGGAADGEAFTRLGAAQVTVLDCSAPARASDQALWESCSRYDIVHCGPALHRCADPVGLLTLLRRLMDPAATMYLAATMLADPERSEYLRFVPGADRRGPEPSFIPGRLAVRWMMQAAGFEILDEFGERPGRGEPVSVVCSYLRAAVAADRSVPDAEPPADALGGQVAATGASGDGHLPPPAS